LDCSLYYAFIECTDDKKPVRYVVAMLYVTMFFNASISNVTLMTPDISQNTKLPTPYAQVT